MIDDETKVVVAYNGEIYNYIELRQTLAAAGHRFRTRSDTEVLLRAYLEWGTSCVSRLNGMWAFVIWDPRIQQAFFSRDRFGIKPFYFCVSNGSLAVASEPKALLSLYPRFRAVDEYALYDLLAHGRVAGGSRSFYRDIQILTAAHWGTFRPGDSSPKLTRYWRAPEPQRSAEPAQRVIDHFAGLFDDSACIRLRSDVPVGITLSGGLDSTAALHAMQAQLKQSSEPVTAFTSVYLNDGTAPAVDEAPWARRAVARYAHVRLREVEFAQRDWLETLRRIVWHMDGPGRSPAVLPLWKIMETARAEQVPVLLEGQGGDELLGGYGHHSAVALLETLGAAVRRPTRSSIREARRLAFSAIEAFSLRGLMRELAVEAIPAVKSSYLGRYGALSTLRPEYARAFGCNEQGQAEFCGEERKDLPSHFERRLRVDFFRDTLPAYLQYGDAISMAHSIETRLPFLDYRVVELCMSLPVNWKIGDGEGKRLLRHYLRRANHHGIAARKDKRGYPTPINTWLASRDGAEARQLLLDSDSCIANYTSRDDVELLINRHVRGHVGVGDHLYRLVTSELWMRECIRS